MGDVATSIVRDLAAKTVGWFVGVLLAIGVAVPADMSRQLTVAVSGTLVLIVQVVYYALVRWAEQRWRRAGALLVVPRAPSYPAQSAPAAADGGAPPPYGGGGRPG